MQHLERSGTPVLYTGRTVQHNCNGDNNSEIKMEGMEGEIAECK
jgi:hypothetical protein